VNGENRLVVKLVVAKNLKVHHSDLGDCSGKENIDGLEEL